MYEGRACYKIEWPGDETYIIDVPIFDDESSSGTPLNYVKRALTLSEVLDELDKVSECIPDIPAFEALRLYFVSVCPTGLIDPLVLFYIEAEQAVREYHTLPFKGGLWDQPKLLLDMFTVIRSERNQYERIRMEEISRKAKKSGSGKGGKNIFSSPNEGLPPRIRGIGA